MFVTGTNQPSKKLLWAGRVLTALTALFMLFDGAMKIAQPASVLTANARLGFPLPALSAVGVVLLACTAMYLIPRTSIVGAILLTGYLGGAVASNVRAGSGWFETIFPALFAALIWLGFGLRNVRLWSAVIRNQDPLVTHNQVA